MCGTFCGLDGREAPDGMRLPGANDCKATKYTLAVNPQPGQVYITRFFSFQVKPPSLLAIFFLSSAWYTSPHPFTYVRSA